MHGLPAGFQRAAISYLPAASDESHTALSWSTRCGYSWRSWFQPIGQFRIALRPADLCYTRSTPRWTWAVRLRCLEP